MNNNNNITSNNSKNSNSGVKIYELQFKIDGKLNELQEKRRQLSKQNASSSEERQKNSKIKHHRLWNVIKKRSLQHRSLKEKKNGNLELKMVKPVKNSDDDLMDTINRIMILERSLIELSRNIADNRRLQMIWIFLQCGLSIIFNAYNLVVFLLKIVYRTGDVPLSLTKLLFFYGYHIITPLMETILSILAYTNVYAMLLQTASIMDEINMYVLDVAINNRISQFSSYVYNNLKVFTLYGLYNLDGTLLTSIMSGTTTYIIILIQYSGDGEICSMGDNVNKTKIKA